ncbi:peptidyl-prolyl cis-trans isomerase D [Gammaproteobacteria bacterium]
MLTSIRERAQGWIAWIIISLIIVVFAVWGIQNFFTADPNLPVLQVDDTEVGLREFQFAYQQQREHLRSVLGNSMDQSSFTDERIKQQVVNDLIERIVLTNAARDLGMRIGDALLATQINAIDAFQVNGHFSKDRYEQILRNQGMTPPNFEQRTRSTLVGQQFYSGVVNTAFLTPKQLDNHLRLEGQTRDINYLTIPASHFLDEVTISEDETRRYYDENQDSYQVPEQVTIAYLELTAETLASHIEATDEALQSLYEETRANYHQEERRRASHILITLDEKADPATVNTAQAKLEELKHQLISGASFEELARSHSQDPGSASQGGDLGFFGRGAMVKPFEERVFSMKDGEISDAVRTSFGFHIIKLTGIEPAHDQSFAEARASVLQEFRRIQAEKQFFERSETLANLSYEHPDSLEPSATQMGLTIQTVGPFTRNGGADIAANPKIVAAAFSEDVLIRSNNSEPIDLTGNRLVVLRVTNHQLARHQSLDEVRETVTAVVRQNHARERAKALGETILKELRAGGDSIKMAEQAKLSWQRLGWVGRQASGLAPELATVAFRVSRPVSATQPSYTGFVLSNGDFAVVQILGVKEGDPTAVSREAHDEARQRLTKAMGEQSFTDLVTDLKAKAKVVVHRERF